MAEHVRPRSLDEGGVLSALIMMAEGTLRRPSTTGSWLTRLGYALDRHPRGVFVSLCDRGRTCPFLAGSGPRAWWARVRAAHRVVRRVLRVD